MEVLRILKRYLLAIILSIAVGLILRIIDWLFFNIDDFLIGWISCIFFMNVLYYNELKTNQFLTP